MVLSSDHITPLACSHIFPSFSAELEPIAPEICNCTRGRPRSTDRRVETMPPAHALVAGVLLCLLDRARGQSCSLADLQSHLLSVQGQCCFDSAADLESVSTTTRGHGGSIGSCSAHALYASVGSGFRQKGGLQTVHERCTYRCSPARIHSHSCWRPCT